MASFQAPGEPDIATKLLYGPPSSIFSKKRTKKYKNHAENKKQMPYSNLVAIWPSFGVARSPI